MTRLALAFLAGSICGLYAWAYLANRIFPEPVTSTIGDGSHPWNAHPA